MWTQIEGSIDQDLIFIFKGLGVYAPKRTRTLIIKQLQLVYNNTGGSFIAVISELDNQISKIVQNKPTRIRRKNFIYTLTDLSQEKVYLKTNDIKDITSFISEKTGKPTQSCLSTIYGNFNGTRKNIYDLFLIKKEKINFYTIYNKETKNKKNDKSSQHRITKRFKRKRN